MPENGAGHGGKYLHQRDAQLHNSAAVGNVVSFLRDNGIQIPNQPNDKLDAFVAFLADTVNDGVLTGDVESLDRQIGAHVVDEQEVTDGFWTVQQGILEKNGETLTEQKKEQIVQSSQETQRTGLEAWATCLAEGNYPDWFRLWVWDSITRLGTYSPQTKKYARRSAGTMAAFPDLNPDALHDVFEQITAQAPPAGGFSKLYGAAVADRNTVEVVPEDQVEGQWVRYHGQRDDSKLSNSLQGKGLQWCVVQRSYAGSYLSRGDVWVFYTPDQRGQCTMPRILIATNPTGISEFCGRLGSMNAGQEIEVELIDAAITKARELGVSEPWEKAAEDVRRLRHLERRVQAGQTGFSVDDLCWLYSPHDMNKFGYGTRSYYDNKRSALLAGRNQQADRAMVDQALDAAYDDTADALVAMMQERHGGISDVEHQWLQKITQREKANFGFLAPTAAVEEVFCEWMSGADLDVAVDIRGNKRTANRWTRYQSLQKYSAERDRVVAGVQGQIGREVTPAESAHIARVVRYDKEFDIASINGCSAEVIDAILVTLGAASTLQGGQLDARREYLRDARFTVLYGGFLNEQRASVLAGYAQRNGRAASRAEAEWLKEMVADTRSAWNPPSNAAVDTLADFLAANPLPEQVPEGHSWRATRERIKAQALYTRSVRLALEQTVTARKQATSWQPSSDDLNWLRTQLNLDASNSSVIPPSWEAGQVLSDIYALEQLPGPGFDQYASDWNRLRTAWHEKQNQILTEFHIHELRQLFGAQSNAIGGYDFIRAAATGSLTAGQLLDGHVPTDAIEMLRGWLAEPKVNFDGTAATELQEQAAASLRACDVAEIATAERARLAEVLAAAGAEPRQTESWCRRLTGMVPSNLQAGPAETRSLPVSPTVVIATAKWLVTGIEGEGAAAAAFDEFRRNEWARACSDVMEYRRPWFRRPGRWNQALNDARRIAGTALGA